MGDGNPIPPAQESTLTFGKLLRKALGGMVTSRRFKNRLLDGLVAVVAAINLVLLALTVMHVQGWWFAKASEHAVVGWLLYWTFIPPLCFWVEYHVLHPLASDAVRKDFTLEMLEKSQKVSGKIWLGVVAFIMAVALKGDNETAQAKAEAVQAVKTLADHAAMVPELKSQLAQLTAKVEEISKAQDDKATTDNQNPKSKKPPGG